MPTQTKLDLHIRWMIRADHEQVAEIEAASYAEPYSEAALQAYLRERTHNTIGMVATDRKYERLIRGYMIYTLEKGRLVVHRIAVAPHCRLQGIGQALVDKLKGKLGLMGKQRRTRLRIDVSERELGAQLFLRSQGFVAIEVNHREETIAFVYTNREA